MAGELAGAIGLGYGAQLGRQGGSFADQMLAQVLADNKRKRDAAAAESADKQKRLDAVMKDMYIDTSKLEARFRDDFEKASAKSIDNIIAGTISTDVNSQIEAKKELNKLKGLKDRFEAMSSDYRNAKKNYQNNPTQFATNYTDPKSGKTYSNYFDIWEDTKNIPTEEISKFNLPNVFADVSDDGYIQFASAPTKVGNLSKAIDELTANEDLSHIKGTREEKVGATTYDITTYGIAPERIRERSADITNRGDLYLDYTLKAWRERNNGKSGDEWMPYQSFIKSDEAQYLPENFRNYIGAELENKTRSERISGRPVSSGGGAGNRDAKWVDQIWQDKQAGMFGFQSNRKDVSTVRTDTTFGKGTKYLNSNGEVVDVLGVFTAQATPKGVMFDYKGGNLKRGKLTGYGVYTAQYSPIGERTDVVNTFYVPLTEQSLASIAGALSMQGDDLLEKARQALPEQHKYEIDVASDIITATQHGKNKPVHTGAGAPYGGGSGNIPTISTKAEFDALPKGTKYKKADGKTYIKG